MAHYPFYPKDGAKVLLFHELCKKITGEGKFTGYFGIFPATSAGVSGTAGHILHTG